MIYPEFIKKGDCIGVPAPSAGADTLERKNKFENAIKRLQNLGFKLNLSENLFESVNGRSASAEERAKEVNKMVKDNETKMILCAAGGEFLVEILDYVDFNLLKENPKFVVGFSDPTGLLFPITTKYDIATIYGQNLSSFGTQNLHKAQEDTLRVMKGDFVTVHSYDLYEEKHHELITGLEDYNLTEKVCWKTLDDNEVSVKGRIIGGCLDIIAELAGTKFDGTKEFNEKYKNDGIIWYFDNCEITMEETIRLLWKMYQLEYFKYAKAIIFGRFGKIATCFDYDTESCLKDSVISKLNIPIIYDADISHKAPCMPIINGSIASLNVKEGKGTISFELSR